MRENIFPPKRGGRERFVCEADRKGGKKVGGARYTRNFLEKNKGLAGILHQKKKKKSGHDMPPMG